MVKTSLHRYMIKSDVEAPNYLEVKDSRTLQMYGQRFLAVPGPKTKLTERIFIDLNPQEVLDRKSIVSESSTLSGISSKFEYIAKVRNSILILRYAICWLPLL